MKANFKTSSAMFTSLLWDHFSNLVSEKLSNHVKSNAIKSNNEIMCGPRESVPTFFKLTRKDASWIETKSH